MSQVQLCPSQQQAVDAAMKRAESDQIVHLWSPPGFGRTTMLTELHRRIGGKWVSIKDVVALVEGRHPLALEESLNAAIRIAFATSQNVFVDDWHLIADVVNGCESSYPRQGYLHAVGAACGLLVETDPARRLFIGTDGDLPGYLRARSEHCGVHELTVEDYQHLCAQFGAPPESDVQFDHVHRFAPRLNVYQLRAVCASCQQTGSWNTDSVIEYLSERHLVSNVSLTEVVDVRFEDLVGMDKLIDQLIANVVFPLENDAVAQRYGLQAKRGVLLLGPPGTGKTTIGKALAHRLRGKFFLIDGTVISGTDHFYYRIHHIIEQAKNNAPAVVFIDDSDVIFENKNEHGLYRYLLTVLDGLESESLQRVCIMMTAMELRHIPPALIRSGRVELWLETELPDETARIELLTRLTRGLPVEIMPSEMTDVARAAERCTPADLKRLVNDAKSAYAWAEVHGRLDQPFAYFMMDAISKLKEMKSLYSKIQQAQENRAARPVWFDVPDPSAIPG